ncbi:hypothetical protein Tcan_11449 [Toxocara canis]|uniref:Uncharacterized protein n=1 Tax=Toxocara canis TaxID=6265 RepID=A0A0B2VPP6_TOXCA|nr:hypothetical protein Tcan_11449 [Toxocara canis]
MDDATNDEQRKKQLHHPLAKVFSQLEQLTAAFCAAGRDARKAHRKASIYPTIQLLIEIFGLHSNALHLHRHTQEYDTDTLQSILRFSAASQHHLQQPRHSHLQSKRCD